MENYSEFFETFEVFTIATNSLISSSLSERTDSKLCSVLSHEFGTRIRTDKLELRAVLV
jgi:hypothetical protein